MIPKIQRKHNFIRIVTSSVFCSRDRSPFLCTTFQIIYVNTPPVVVRIASNPHTTGLWPAYFWTVENAMMITRQMEQAHAETTPEKILFRCWLSSGMLSELIMSLRSAKFAIGLISNPWGFQSEKKMKWTWSSAIEIHNELVPMTYLKKKRTF